MREIRVLDEVFQRCLAHDVPVAHVFRARDPRLVDELPALRIREAVTVADLADLSAREVERVAGSQRIRVETNVGADATALGAAVAEKYGDRIVRVPRRAPQSALHLATVNVDLHHVFRLEPE